MNRATNTKWVLPERMVDSPTQQQMVVPTLSSPHAEVSGSITLLLYRQTAQMLIWTRMQVLSTIL